jgi:heme a synthase
MKLDRFQRWALATTAATYLLIGIGGFVRAAGAGLGCPDWPRCFGRWIPPTDVSQIPPSIDPALFNFQKAWIEYINRLVGVAIGILIFVTLIYAIRTHRREPRILWPTVIAFLLVGFEGWLGGQVVYAKLAPLVLSAHLACALVLAGLLLYATVCAFFPEGRSLKQLPADRRSLAKIGLAILIFTLLQVSIGAVVRGEVQLLGKSGAPRETWLTSIGTIYHVHANLAVLVAAAVTALAWLAWIRGLRRSAIALELLVGAQAATGIGLSQLDVPPALQLLHLWIGSLIIAVETLIVLLAIMDRSALPGSGSREDRAPALQP